MTLKPTDKATTPRPRAGAGFKAEERAAMRERAKELKAEARAVRDRAAGEADLQAQIDAMPAADRALATRVQALVQAHAPGLVPRTWYGMPAWARDGKVVVFFQAASKFRTRYATLGFTDSAGLDAGAMWPTAYALARMEAAEDDVVRTLLSRLG